MKPSSVFLRRRGPGGRVIWRRPVLVLLLVFSLHGPTGANPQRATWASHGPSTGGEIATLGVAPSSPDVVYAALGGFENVGVYRSDDSGETWSRASDGLPDTLRPQSIVVDPDDPRTAYAAFDGVYKTIDGGASWVAADSGLPGDGFVNSLVADPADGGRLYIAHSHGLFRSDDGGRSWTAAAAGLPDGAPARALAVSPTAPDVLYAVVLHERPWGPPPHDGAWRVYRSADRGESWAPTAFRAHDFVYALAAAPTDPATVYAGMGEGLIKKTADGGATWSTVSNGLPDAGVRSLEVGPSPSTVYAGTLNGLYITNDGGATWTEDDHLPPQTQARSVEAAAADPSRLYVGTCCDQGGVWRSDDGGTTWEDHTQGFPSSLRVRPVAADPTRPGVVYAGAYTGAYESVFRGTEGARRWKSAGRGIPPGTSMSSLAVGAANADVVLAGAYSAGVYRSLDGAKTWAKTGLSGASIEAVAIAPSNPSRMYAGGYIPTFQSGAPPVVFRSEDGGETWTSDSLGFPPYGVILDLAVNPMNPDIVYAAGSYHGIYKSTDGGQTWLNLSAGLANVPVYSVAVDPSNPSTVYVAAGFTPGATSGVYKSTNGGLLWLPTGLIGAFVSSIVLDPANPQKIYAAMPADERMLMATADGGATWTPMNEGLQRDYAPVMLDIQRDGKKLYAGSDGRGVFTVDLE